MRSKAGFVNRNVVRFVLPSLAGILIFLTPVRWNGNSTIGIGIITGWIKAMLGTLGLPIVVGILALTAVLTFLGTVFKSDWIHRNARLKELYDVPMIWLLLRTLGAVFGSMYLFQVGPDLIISKQIGGAVFVDIGVNVLTLYIAACLLMPLLTDFGFMEFAGTLARPVFRKVFRLPGRSAIDAVTSFLGSASIGLLITTSQYNSGNYSARQACVIATNFSVVSITFALVVAAVAGIEHLFISWYGIVILACLLAAVITPRLPPLSRKKDVYASGAICDDAVPKDGSHSLFKEAWQSALQRAERSPGLRELLSIGWTNMTFFLFSVMAAGLALATLASLLTFHTPIFTWLGYPFVTLLELARLPDALTASPALFSGFLDQYMPAIIAAGIDSEVTSFVLAGLSVCQLIFMSEVGVIILRSSLPLSITDLVLIFLLRTVIILPVLILGAHWVVN